MTRPPTRGRPRRGPATYFGLIMGCFRIEAAVATSPTPAHAGIALAVCGLSGAREGHRCGRKSLSLHETMLVTVRPDGTAVVRFDRPSVACV